MESPHVMIASPTRSAKDPQRFIDCQKAVEDRIIDLVADAYEAGWEQSEILAAILEIADTLSLVMDEGARQSVETHLVHLMKSHD
jgi:hypothetical protein